MKVLVIGAGGREHALCWKISQSKRVSKVYCAPGNAGTGRCAENINIKPDDPGELLRFAKKEKIDLTVVGPEQPLVLGITDLFTENGLRIFGPSKYCSRLEGSKSFAKNLMKKYGIPTADFKVFSDAASAKAYVREKGAPIVIKADGLAAGKGVTVAGTIEDAEKAIDDAIARKIFGAAGSIIVVEEALSGEEASILAISDGKNKVMLDSSQDHKRVFDYDKGPNTGGMGAYSPAPVITKDLFEKIEKQVIDPLIKGMAEEGNPFKGVIYAGIMVTENGPEVLEFNVRFGDPETQAILPRIKTDLVDIMEGSVDGRLDRIKMQWDKKSAVTVVLASVGYPGEYEKGKIIEGLDDCRNDKDTVVFHAGTRTEDGAVVTSGGRVLNVTSLGDDLKGAIEAAYKTVGKIKFNGMYYRKDIGQKGIKVQHG